MSDTLTPLIAARVRSFRKDAGLSRRVLSDKTDISERYLAQLEAAKANISMALLQRICRALDVSLTEMVRHNKDEGIDPQLAKFICGLNGKSQKQALDILRRHFAELPRQGKSGVALFGIRGCGKTTLAATLARKTGMPFVRLSEEIARISGMSVAELAELGGIAAYRRYELAALQEQIRRSEPVIIEASGGIADSPRAFELMLDNFNTVYLKATAREHFDRVTAQHDTRLMHDRENSIHEIKTMLAKRKAAFERAHDVLDTSNKSIDACSRELLAIARRYLRAAGADPS